MVINSSGGGGGGGGGGGSQGNIFLTTENLAFSLPLIVVCGAYAFFNYIPLKVGIPIFLGTILIYQIGIGIKKIRENKIQHMDEKEIFDLAMELDDDDEKKKAKEKEEMKQKKKKSRVEERLASEKRKEEKAAKNSSKKKGNNSNDDDDDNNIATFAKGSGSRSQRKH